MLQNNKVKWNHRLKLIDLEITPKNTQASFCKISQIMLHKMIHIKHLKQSMQYFDLQYYSSWCQWFICMALYLEHQKVVLNGRLFFHKIMHVKLAYSSTDLLLLSKLWGSAETITHKHLPLHQYLAPFHHRDRLYSICPLPNLDMFDW